MLYFKNVDLKMFHLVYKLVIFSDENKTQSTLITCEQDVNIRIHQKCQKSLQSASQDEVHAYIICHGKRKKKKKNHQILSCKLAITFQWTLKREHASGRMRAWRRRRNWFERRNFGPTRFFGVIVFPLICTFPWVSSAC